MEFKQPANSNDVYKNVVLPFSLEESGIKGQFVRLSEEVHNILSSHKYPVRVSQLLGEMLILVSMLGSMLKLKGMLSIQAQGDGAIGFICADYTENGDLRGYAHINDRKFMQKIDVKDRKEQDVTEVFGKGHIVITIENKGERPYQAIVPLEGKTLKDCLLTYFKNTGQLDVMLEVAVKKINRQWRAGGIVLQRFPEEKHNENKADDWNTAGVLLSSITDKELVDDHLLPTELLFRLFHEDGVRVFDPQKLQAKCRCSRKRMENALSGLTPEEIEDMKVKDEITMTCHFCNRKEVFKNY